MSGRRVSARDIDELAARVDLLHARRNSWRGRTPHESFEAVLRGEAVAPDLENIYEDCEEDALKTFAPRASWLDLDVPPAHASGDADARYIVSRRLDEPVDEAVRARMEQRRHAPNPHHEQPSVDTSTDPDLERQICNWMLDRLVVMLLDRHEMELRRQTTELSEQRQTTSNEDGQDRGPSYQQLVAAYEATHGPRRKHGG